jgi:sarcosine oxidase subunit gamma
VPDAGHIGSAAPGRYGAPGASPLALHETRFAAMWNVQGAASVRAFADAARALLGVVPPPAPNTIARTARWSLVWLGPRSWLALASPPSPTDAPLPVFEPARDAINAAGGALFEVSAARAAWTITGEHAETVLAKLCPLDFDRRAFPAGTCAQSLLGHLNALYLREATGAFTLLVAASYAHDAWHALCTASAQYGYEVFAPR